METVLFVIEYDGSITLNNEFTAESSVKEPVIIEWFQGSDLIIETCEKFFVNTSSIENVVCARIIKIEPNIYIVRPIKKNTEKSPRKENRIDADCVEYTSQEIIAVKELHTQMKHVRISKFKTKEGRLFLAETYIATKIGADTVPQNPILAFVQCVQLKDFENARSLLTFEISNKHLLTYFGEEFEILGDNYLKEKNIISIIPKESPNFVIARNVVFQTDGAKISNVV